MATKLIQISLSRELLARIDAAAHEDCVNRSEFIRYCVVERLRYMQECHAKLLAIAQTTDPPAEEELYQLLRLKDGQRKAVQLRRQLRKTTQARGL
jgi:metal-responsive CopG/Arc/MetJ family transcriptional regulator